MSFAQNLNRICRENGTTLTHVLKELGFSSSKVTAINHGQIPNNETDLKRIAAALHCSVIDLFMDEEDIFTVDPQNEDELDILNLYRSLDRRRKHEFMALIYDFERRKELEGDNANDTKEQDNTNRSAV